MSKYIPLSMPQKLKMAQEQLGTVSTIFNVPLHPIPPASVDDWESSLRDSLGAIVREETAKAREETRKAIQTPPVTGAGPKRWHRAVILVVVSLITFYLGLYIGVFQGRH